MLSWFALRTASSLAGISRLSVVVVLAVIVATSYLHYRDQRTSTDDAWADARRDHRSAPSELAVGGSPFTLLFAWLRKRRSP